MNMNEQSALAQKHAPFEERSRAARFAKLYQVNPKIYRALRQCGVRALSAAQYDALKSL